MTKNTPTICSFCSNGCGMFIRTKGAEPLGVLPIIGHPVSEGRLCHRGWNRFQNLYSLHRITNPLVREGMQLKEVSWEETLRRLKDRLSELISSYGPQSVGVIGSPWLTNEDNYVISAFCQRVLNCQNLDGSYRFSGAQALSGLAHLFPEYLGSLGSIPSLRESPGILVCGRESLRDFSPVGSRIIQSYLGGGKLILSDPLSQRAEHFYHVHLPQALGNLASAFKEKVAIPDEVFRHLAQPGSAMVFVADNVKQPSDLASLIDVMTDLSPGHDKIPGIIPLSRSPNLRGAWDMGVKSLAGGLNLQEMLDAGSQIKGLLIFADDLVNHLPLPSMIEKLKGLEFLLVADRFVTETTRIAHYILPLPLLAESEGTLTNCEGRVQKIRPALKPKGESRNLREVLTLLSEALGNPLPSSSDAEVRKEIGMTIPGYQRITNDSELDSVSGTLLPRPAKIVAAPQSSEIARGVKEGDQYVLFIPNTLYAWNRNQMILESPVLNIEYPADRLALRMCSKDARELKVRMGEKVRIKSERGEAQIEVEPDENLPQRTLVLPSHFISIVAPLTGNGEIDSGTRSRYYPDIPVTLEKL